MKTMIVTGASSGIGAEIVKNASTQGWQVLMVARRKEKMEEIASSLQNVQIFPCDLSQAEAIQSLCQELESFDIQALVNNAGVFEASGIAEDDDSLWDRHYQMNLMSAVRLTRGLWDNLKKNKASIVNISSTLAIRPIPGTAAYSALKAAMNNWSLSLAIEGAPEGVRSNCICPGIVETPIHAFHGSEREEDKKHLANIQSAQPLGRTGQVHDIAPMVLQLCGEGSKWTTGTTINVDGGILLNS